MKNYAYNNNVQYVDGYMDEEEDAEFDQYVKRRTRRFYLGGFRQSITEKKLAGYITRRGLKVTKISIFRNRGKYRNNVVIRVNVQDDDNANSMTDDPYFWPEGVVCRPWIPFGTYRKRRSYYNEEEDNNAEYDNDEYDHGRSQYNNNRYSVLECDIDD